VQPKGKKEFSRKTHMQNCVNKQADKGREMSPHVHSWYFYSWCIFLSTNCQP